MERCILTFGMLKFQQILRQLKESSTCEVLVHADEMMIIVKATTEGDEHDFQWEWIAAEANSPRYLIFKRQGKANKIPKDYELNPTAKISNEKEVNLSVQKLLAGGETSIGWQETHNPETERTLWINLTHTYLKTIRVKYAKLKSEKLYVKVITPCKKHIVNGGILSILVVS